MVRPKEGPTETEAYPITLTELFDFFRAYSERGLPITVEPVSVSVPLLDELVTINEVSAAISGLSCSTSSGQYPVSTEMFKFLAENHIFLSNLKSVFNNVLDTALFPDGWLDGTLTPLSKKGKAVCAKNCRPIVVEKLPMRLLSTIVARRLELWAGIEDDQSGFRRERSTWDQVFVLHSICKRLTAERKECYLAFLDYTSAFDTVSHGRLFENLVQRGISAKMFSSLAGMYAGGKNCIKWKG